MDAQRTQLLIGANAAARLARAHVIVVGLGGVGSYCVETLARAGIGKLTLIDSDVIHTSNCNRQLFALNSTVGRAKTDVAAERVADINADCTVVPHCVTVDANNAFDLIAPDADYVVDAIDTVTAKLALMRAARERNVPIVSCMGTGNKLHADFRVDAIERTSGCPLARAVRKLCREQGIEGVKAVYAPDPSQGGVVMDGTRHAPGSISYVPAQAGLRLCEAVITDLLNEGEHL